MNAAVAATARYHDLLAEGRAASCRKALHDNADQLRLADNVVAHSLRPCFVTEDAYSSAMRATSSIATALQVAHTALTHDARLRAELGLSEAEEEIVSAEPTGSTEFTGRFDGLFDGAGTLRFVEYNSLAAGLMMVDWMWRVYDAMPIMADLRARFTTRHESTSRCIVPAFLRSYRSRGGVGLPTIAMVSASPATSTMRFEEWSVMADLVSDAGCATIDTRPEELEVVADEVRVAGRRIDVVFMDDWPLLRRLVPPAHPFWRAVRERRVWIANSRANNILRGDKRIFAFLSDPGHAHLFEPEVLGAIARHIPWTRIVRASTTLLDGRSVNLLEVVRRNRSRFVLKPASSYGGKGVVLGSDASPSEWDAAITLALRTPHVVQERVNVTREPFPFVGDGDFEYRSCHSDFSPFLWSESDAIGVLARVSQESVVNVTSGGSAAPVFSVASA